MLRLSPSDRAADLDCSGRPVNGTPLVTVDPDAGCTVMTVRTGTVLADFLTNLATAWTAPSRLARCAVVPAALFTPALCGSMQQSLARELWESLREEAMMPLGTPCARWFPVPTVALAAPLHGAAVNKLLDVGPVDEVEPGGELPDGHDAACTVEVVCAPLPKARLGVRRGTPVCDGPTARGAV